MSRPTGVQVAAVLVTRGMPGAVHRHLAERCRLEVWEGEGVMPRAELLDRVAGKAGLMAMLTDRVDAELLDRAGPGLRMVANFAVATTTSTWRPARPGGCWPPTPPTWSPRPPPTWPGRCSWPRPGGSPRGTRVAMGMTAADNLLAALEGRRPPNLLNPGILG